MVLKRLLVTGFIKILLRAICTVRPVADSDVPRAGPGIIMVNHINFLEVPLLYVFFLPCRIVGLVKRETWKNPLLRVLADVWQAIPITRHGVDSEAFHAIERALHSGKLVAIAPEGTRSGDGRLGRGYPGITSLAWIHQVPVYPIAHYGGENVWANMKRLKRTEVTIRVGSPVHIASQGKRLTKTMRQSLTHELMLELAHLLPEHYRGHYRNYRPAASGFLRPGLPR